MSMPVAAAAACLLLLSAGCATDPPAAPPRIPVIVDTDMGADDIVALLYLLGRSDVDLIAVTVVGDGIVTCPAGGAAARAVLAAAGRVDIPVACGTTRPLAGERAFPDQWRRAADGIYGMAGKWPAPTAGAPAGADPVALLADQIRRHPGVQVLALGPLTTVALALRQPEVVASRPRIIVSGGAVNEPGNMPVSGRIIPVAEWNIGIDPAAADEVLRSGLTTTWVTLDATNEVPVDVWFTQALAAQDRNAAGNAALEFLRDNAALSRGGFYFWDPLAVALVTTPGVVATRSADLAVVTDGMDSGRTIVDSAGNRVDITSRAKPNAFYEAMLDAFAAHDTGGAAAYVTGRAVVQVRQDSGDYTIEAPATTAAGDTTIGLDATGGGSFVVVMARLLEGRTMADVLLAIDAGVTSAPSWFAVVASMEAPSGALVTWLVDLEPGDYALVAAQLDGSAMTAVGSLTAV